jgi:hypothetical protein
MRIITGLLSLVSITLLLGTIVLLGAGLVLGMGWLLHKVFPVVTIFEGSVLAVGVSVSLILYLSLTEMKNTLQDVRYALTPQWSWGEDDEEWDEDDEEMDEVAGGNGRERAPFSDAVSASRNAPCPCGSGRKYKNCCGRNKE